MMSSKKLVVLMLCGAGLTAQPLFAQKYVCMESNLGEWCMELAHDAAPLTVENFLRYVENGDYIDSIIHRSIPGFVIQGGALRWDANDDLLEVDNHGPIPGEASWSNVRGTVGMVRLAENRDSASSEWYVNLDDNVQLDTEAGGYTVFGRIVHGMDVIDRIAALDVRDFSDVVTIFWALPTTSSGSVNRPDVVLITETYSTDVLPSSTLLPYHCTPDVAADALTEYCNDTVKVPVQIEGLAYEATLELLTAAPMVFVLKSGPTPIEALPPSYATFDPAANVVRIPSVRVGHLIYDSVVLEFSNTPSPRLTLKSFELRL